MPVVLRIKGYAFWFYQADLEERPHVHIGRGGKEAKYWLSPVEASRGGRFRSVELREIERIIIEHLEFLMEAWAKEQSKRAHN